jgi:hypothetical protein
MFTTKQGIQVDHLVTECNCNCTLRTLLHYICKEHTNTISIYTHIFIQVIILVATTVSKKT